MMLELDQIISNAITFPKNCVYFLLEGMEVVYVGKSKNLITRLSAHLLSKKFDKIFFIECDGKNVSQLEIDYIKKYKPLYNVKHNDMGEGDDLIEVKIRIAVDSQEYRTLLRIKEKNEFESMAQVIRYLIMQVK